MPVDILYIARHKEDRNNICPQDMLHHNLHMTDHKECQVYIVGLSMLADTHYMLGSIKDLQNIVV
jgi:hypothetical protein